VQPTLRGIIFDMDGVLVNTEPIHARAWVETLADLGQDFRPEDFLDWVGIPDEKFSSYYVETRGLRISAPDLLERKRVCYRRRVQEALRPDADLGAGLAGLRDRNLQVAVATSSSRADAEHTLACAGLRSWFATVITVEDVTRHKPAPEPFLAAAAGLGVPAGACAVIEDSPAGVQGAKDAGCLVLGITSTHPAANLAAADRTFATTPDAIAWILGAKTGAERSAS